VKVSAESNVDGKYTMLAAAYSDDGRMLSAITKRIAFEKFVPLEMETDVKTQGKISVFFWDDNLAPVSEKITV
ncbi:MAG: hypothetical protein ACI4SS_02145, partial [Clostridia bacterium]